MFGRERIEINEDIRSMLNFLKKVGVSGYAELVMCSVDSQNTWITPRQLIVLHTQNILAEIYKPMDFLEGLAKLKPGQILARRCHFTNTLRVLKYFKIDGDGVLSRKSRDHVSNAKEITDAMNKAISEKRTDWIIYGGN